MSDDVSPHRFLDDILGFQKTAALKSALALDLFSAIGRGGATAADAAKRAGAAERGVRILCDFLTLNGHLEKEGARYTLTPSSAAFLDRASPMYMGSVADFLASPEHIGRYLNDPVSFVRYGGSVGAQCTAPEDPSWITFATAMVPFMQPVVQAVARTLSELRLRPRRILDIAAGHGLFGITLARASANATVVALDWPKVLELARENAVQAGIGDRYETIAGDAFEVDWGRGYDLVLIPNFLHHFDAGTNRSLLARARGALVPGGRIILVEMVPNEDRVSPPFPAAFAYMMLGATPRGDAYTLSQWEAMGREAGLSKLEAFPLPPSPQTMLVYS